MKEPELVNGDNPWYKFQDAMRLTGLGRQTLTNYIADGTIQKHTVIGKRQRFIHRDEIEKILGYSIETGELQLT